MKRGESSFYHDNTLLQNTNRQNLRIIFSNVVSNSQEGLSIHTMKQPSFMYSIEIPNYDIASLTVIALCHFMLTEFHAPRGHIRTFFLFYQLNFIFVETFYQLGFGGGFFGSTTLRMNFSIQNRISWLNVDFSGCLKSYLCFMYFV